MDFKNYFKQIEQFQKRMDKLYAPLMSQNQIWAQSIQTQIEPINKNMELFSDAISKQIIQTELALKPVVEVLNRQRALIERLEAIDNSSFANIRKWHLSIDRLVNFQSGNLNDPLPESFNDPINDLTLELDNFQHFSEDTQEMPTVREPLVTQDKKMTWADLINITLNILQIFLILNSDNASSIQRDKQILEAENQTKLLERQVEATEKQTEAIKEQTKAIKEQTKFEQERYEQQQRFEENFNIFIESLEPYITDQLPVDDD